MIYFKTSEKENQTERISTTQQKSNCSINFLRNCIYQFRFKHCYLLLVSILLVKY